MMIYRMGFFLVWELVARAKVKNEGFYRERYQGASKDWGQSLANPISLPPCSSPSIGQRQLAAGRSEAEGCRASGESEVLAL